MVEGGLNGYTPIGVQNTIRRIQAINDTKIQYISVADTKIYKVKDIDFKNLTIEAAETDLSIADVPQSEVFPVEEFGEFRVRLINGGGDCMGEIIDFAEWVERNK